MDNNINEKKVYIELIDNINIVIELNDNYINNYYDNEINNGLNNEYYYKLRYILY
jgi:hypothetical protein